MHLRTIALSTCLLACGATAAQEPTLEDIISGCARAMGGSDKIAALETLTFKAETPGKEPLLWEIRRPNLVRKERTGELILVFDGERAGFLKAPPDKDGKPRKPFVVPEEDWHHFEMDIALYVPAFFEYPAEYRRKTKVGDAGAHLLSVELPMGGQAEYALDAETFLPLMVSLPGWSYERCLGRFTEVDGINYPLEYWTCSEPEKVSVITDLEINTSLAQHRFSLAAIQ